MAKKFNPISMLIGLAVLIAIVYFFRPQTFNFLKQGFTSLEEEYTEEEGFDGCPEGKKDDGEGNCVSEGFSGSMPCRPSNPNYPNC